MIFYFGNFIYKIKKLNIMKNSETIIVRITPHLKQQLTQLSEDSNINISKIVRYILEKNLKNIEGCNTTKTANTEPQ